MSGKLLDEEVEEMFECVEQSQEFQDLIGFYRAENKKYADMDFGCIERFEISSEYGYEDNQYLAVFRLESLDKDNSVSITVPVTEKGEVNGRIEGCCEKVIGDKRRLETTVRDREGTLLTYIREYDNN